MDGNEQNENILTLDLHCVAEQHCEQIFLRDRSMTKKAYLRNFSRAQNHSFRGLLEIDAL